MRISINILHGQLSVCVVNSTNLRTSIVLCPHPCKYMVSIWYVVYGMWYMVYGKYMVSIW